jgi:hypothetical protein
MISNLIQEKIAALQTLDTPALRRLWGETFGGPPPKPMRRDLLLRAIAYHVQEQAQGGLRPATRRRLARAAQDLSSERRPVAGPMTIKAGTRFLREWQGVIHEVARIVLPSSDRDIDIARVEFQTVSTTAGFEMAMSISPRDAGPQHR